MVEYIIKLVEKLIDASKITDSKSQNDESIISLFRTIYNEVDKLNPNDFPSENQYEFVILKEHFRNKANMRGFHYTAKSDFIKVGEDLISLLKCYRKSNSKSDNQDFSFMNDKELKAIVERDYEELNSILFPYEAWKSCVIMAGSILEAILYDVLSNPKYIKLTLVSKRAPKDKGGNVKDLSSGKWKLVDLINVAIDINILPKDRADSIDQVLRDYRNFVHPKKEIKASHPCTKAEGLMSKGALDSICNHLKSNI